MIKVLKADADSDGFITRVHWMMTVPGVTGSHKSAFTFPKRERKVIPFDQVNERTMIKWVEDRLGLEGKKRLQEKIISYYKTKPSL